MSKYTSLETSKKLYEAFPEWNDDAEMYYWAKSETLFEGKHSILLNTPARDTDYLLDKLPDFIEVSNKIYPLIMERKRAGYLDYGTGKYGDVDKNGENLAEALALLALELKKEGIL